MSSSSLNSILSIARSALLTHQRAIGVVSHNLANVNTPGYSRQRLDIRAATPLRLPGGGILGRGIEAGGATRIRDRLLDDNYRREATRGAFFQMTGDSLRRVESAMGELGEGGVGAGLDEFLNAWAELAADPTNSGARSMVRQTGSVLSRRLNLVAERVEAEQRQAGERLQEIVDDVNRITTQINTLNREIVSSSATGSAPDLEDQRDTLIDQLAGYGDVRALLQPDGSVSVLFGDVLIADGASAVPIEVVAVGDGLGVAIRGSATAFDARSGEIRAIADLTQETLPDLMDQLDAFAAALVSEVNALHAAGQTTGGATGVNFFSATDTTAGTIQLDPAILASLDSIVTGSTAAAGANDVALALGALRSTPSAALGGRTLSDGFARIVGDLGVLARGALDNADAQATLSEHLDLQRTSLSGVSSDEELIQLMRAQQAFGAAAKIVTVADEMAQSVLQMIR